MNNPKTHLPAIAAFLAIFAACAASAAEFGWSGAGDASWGNAANWTLLDGSDDDGIPDIDDNVWFHVAGTYPSAITLDGDRECNSLNYSNLVSFTVGAAGETLTIASGSVNSWHVQAQNEQVIACDLRLESPTGTNSWCLHRQWTWNVPSYRLRIDGRVTTDGIMRFYSTNNGRHGKVAFKDAGHQFGGGPFLDGGTLEVLDSPYADVFGDYPIVFGNSGALMLYNSEQTLTNAIDTAKARGTIGIYPYVKAVTLATDIDVPANSELVLGNSGSTLMKLDPEMAITGPGKLQIMRGGIAFSSTRQFPDGNFFIGNAGGCMIFDGITWGDFTSHYANGYGTGNLQWRIGGGGGFAAHGAPVVIGGANAGSWFDCTATFGPLGGSMSDNIVRAYCDAPVIVESDIVLTGRPTYYSNYSADAPGFAGMYQSNRLNEFRGSVTGSGAPRFEGRSGNDEIVFAGTNNCWTGSQCQNDHYGAGNKASSVNTGPGGIATHQASGCAMIIQFASPESLPKGNGGAAAWLAATSRYSGSQGYLMGAKEGGATYNLPEGYRYLMGSNNGNTIGIIGASGPAGTSATIAGDMVCMHAAEDNQAAQLRFVVRGPAECFAGGSGAPLSLAPTYGFEDGNIDNGDDGAATVVSSSESGSLNLHKNGEGTLVLQNIAYTTLDGNGDTSDRFTWYIGEDANIAGNNNTDCRKYLSARNWRYFAGAVRETGSDISNSTAAFPVYFVGGVIELDGVDFRRDVANSPAAGEINLRWGGGFAAHGSDAAVELNDGAIYTYNDNNDGFNRADRGLIFGSRTANATVLFKNDIDFWNRTPYLMTVRGTGSVPEVRLEGQLSRGGFVLTGTTTYKGEELPAGTLELAHPNNIIANKIDVERGTLLVSGAISNGTANVTVMAQGTLGGTGVVKRPVVVNEGGTLAPGNLGVGTLTIAGNLVLDAGAVLAYEESGDDRDLVSLEGGRITLGATGSVALAGDVYGSRKLVAGAGSTAGASDLSGWTVTGVRKPELYSVELDGNDIVLHGMAAGTVILFR